VCEDGCASSCGLRPSLQQNVGLRIKDGDEITQSRRSEGSIQQSTLMSVLDRIRHSQQS
jgi:hypothetical protein